MMTAWMMTLAMAIQAPGACPESVAGWATPAPLASGGSLKVGRTATLGLLPAAGIRFARPPERAPAPGTHAGTVSVTIAAAGRYRVLLDGPAWIDLLSGGRAVPSTAHSHGAPCSGVRKMVDFDLKPGTYTLQLSGAKTPGLRVMLTRS